MTKRLKKVLMGLAALGALALGGAALAGAASSPDQPTTGNRSEQGENDAREQASGSQAERAKAAALEATHGGRANGVERDSEDGATWEVEVTKQDGNTVDVRLDDQLKVVVIEGDSESTGG